MFFPHKSFGAWNRKETPAGLVEYQDAEASASSDASASCYSIKENVGILTVVVPPRKFVQVQRQILLGDVMKTSHDAALEQTPKRFDIVRVDNPSHVFALPVTHGCVRQATRLEQPITRVFVGSDQLQRSRQLSCERSDPTSRCRCFR